MRKSTEIFEQIPNDGRFQGQGIWAKLAFFWFILFLSYKCTKRCNYCYAFNQVGSDNKMEMDDNTFSKLLEWIPEVWRVNNIKVNAVTFLGGEPLLRTDRIKQVMNSVKKNTDGMQGNVYTNGDLIDTIEWNDIEDIQWIAINITDISIDELDRRMRIISERSNVKGQTIAVTLDEYNIARISDIARFGIENGYRLRFYRNLYKGMDYLYKSRLLKEYHELCDLLEKFVIRGYDVSTTFLFDTLIASWDHESSPYLCGKRIATVYPDGTIGPCLRNHSYKTGTIFDSDPMDKINCKTFHHEIANPGVPEACRECTSRSACQGGCPHDKLLLTGTASGKSVVCDIHKEIIPRLRNLEKLKLSAAERANYGERH